MHKDGNSQGQWQLNLKVYKANKSRYKQHYVLQYKQAHSNSTTNNHNIGIGTSIISIYNSYQKSNIYL